LTQAPEAHGILRNGRKLNNNVPNINNRDKGQAVIVLIMFLLLVALSLTSRATGPVRTDAELARDLYSSKQAGALSDAGIEDVTYRIKKAFLYDAIEYVRLGLLTSTTTVVTATGGSSKTVTALGDVDSRIRQKGVTLIKGDRVEFNYGVQTGEGGFALANTASVLGNIYANGPVTGAGNTVTGTVVSAGPSGLISGIYATQSLYAHTIQNSSTGGSAYYQIGSGINLIGGGGALYPDSPDRATSSMPISDAQIAEWEADAVAGGTISGPCPYKIITGVTIGPIKINCDLELSNSAVVTIAGPVWVNGNISFKNSAGVKLASALGSNSTAFIADKLTNRITASLITILNSTTFTDSGTAGSFLFLISGNTAQGMGPNGAVTAIDLANTASGPVVLYSNHGMITLGNSSQLKSITGYLVSMKNSAQLIYDEGLESALFDTGPGGSWDVDVWKETQ